MSEDIGLLLEHAAVPAMAIDPYSVLRGGRRRRRQRRFANGGLALAVAAGIAVTGVQVGWWQPGQARVASPSADRHVDLSVSGVGGSTQTFRATLESSGTGPATVRLLAQATGIRWKVLLTVPDPGQGNARVETTSSGEPVALILANGPASSEVVLTLSDGTQVQRTLVAVPGSPYAVAVVAGIDLGKATGPMTVTVH